MKILGLLITSLIAAQTPGQLPRDLAAVQIDQRTATPAIPGDTTPQIPATQLEQQSAAPLEVPFDVAIVNGSLRASLASFAQSYGLNLSMGQELDQKITEDLSHVTLVEALDAILPPLNLKYEINGKLLRVFKEQMELRTFTFDYVTTLRSASRSLSASASAGFSGGGVAGGGGGGVAGGSATSITGSESTDVMKDVDEGLKKFESAQGSHYFNKNTGIIFVTDYPKYLDGIKYYLDVIQNAVNKQVVIEATLIEVQLNDQTQSGINWNAVLGTTLSISSSMASQTAFSISAQHGNTSALVTALSTYGNVNVRSAPTITVMNNQPAVIRVGTQDVFFVTTTQTDPRTGTIIQSATTPATVNEGVVLDVTPHISDDNVITMNVHPTITERTGQATSPQGSSVPIVDVRETDTLVRVPEGEMVVIAGLISDRTLQNSSKVPLLGDVPGIGGLFRRNSVEHRKTDLAVLLTPKILTLRTAVDYTKARMAEQNKTLQSEKTNK